MKIQNAKVYTSNKDFVSKNIYIDNGIFTKENFDEENIDASNLYAIPGLIDTHFHGAMGEDFCTANMEGFSKIASFEAEHGTCCMCPTTLTISDEDIVKALKSINEFYNKTKKENEADIIGINLEGPFISKLKKGAQNEEYIQKADIKTFKKYQEAAGGLIKLVDLAPEETRLHIITELSREVIVSIAHTNCTYDEAALAIEAGASHFTHLYNAMPEISHRTTNYNLDKMKFAKSSPGPVIAGYESKKCRAEIITDGIHVHPAMIRLAINLYGEDNMIMISDSLRSTGLKEGEYELGGQKFVLKGKAGYLLDGTLAGSASTLFDCLKYAVKEANVKFEVAVAMATMNPAKEMGVFDKYGSIDIGKVANLLLIDEDFNLKHVILRGKMIK